VAGAKARIVKVAQLQTQTVTCNLCGSAESRLIFPSTVQSSAEVADYVSTNTDYGRYHNIVQCTECGLLYMSPRDIGIPDFYGEVEDQAYLDTWEERAITFRGHLELLKKIKSAGKILDVGCYAGIFLHEAKKAGYEVAGIEPSRWASEYARQKTGAQVWTGTCERITLPPAEFDVVTVWDVVEHFEDPSACFRALHPTIKPGGLILVTTHDIDSRAARIFGKRYPWLMRFHLFHFSPKTLGKMLRRCGFEIISTEYYTKKFSVDYLMSRLGLRSWFPWFKKILVPVPTGDMFLIAARKPDAARGSGPGEEQAG